MAAPALFGAAPTHAGQVRDAATAAPHDEHLHAQAHTRFNLLYSVTVVVVGGLLWVLPLAALIHWHGWQGQYAQLGWFFSKAALLTFGGAYAVLPYVYQGAVLHYGWLSAAQMIDGLALGESTPGPLIMIVTFVGFIAGYESGPLAAQSPWVSGLLGAAIATWFTFLPSFVFILGGAPLVEATRGNRKFTAPLTAISAAVVGVIASLAMFFAEHTLQTQEGVDYWAVAIAIAAFLALHRARLNVVLVLLACGLAGILRHVLIG
jgi:chromate transporter